MSGQAFALILIAAATILGLLALREAALDFAERQFADEFGGDRANRHRLTPSNDVEARALWAENNVFHSACVTEGVQRNHGA
jgi:hypothetical protein